MSGECEKCHEHGLECLCASGLTTWVKINHNEKFFENLEKFKREFFGMKSKEQVDHPDHYQGNKFEVIDIIEDFELGFRLGNSIKYILRSNKKDDYCEDLKKAIWYLQREIENYEN